MTVSPFEVERREFGSRPFGYSRREVDAFLDEVAATLKSVWQERSDLRDETQRLRERLENFTQIEDQLTRTLVLAQDTAERASVTAREEADALVRDARLKAQEIVAAAHQEHQRLERSVRELQTLDRQVRTRLRALAQDVLIRTTPHDTALDAEAAGDADEQGSRRPRPVVTAPRARVRTREEDVASVDSPV